MAIKDNHTFQLGFSQRSTRKQKTLRRQTPTSAKVWQAGDTHQLFVDLQVLEVRRRVTDRLSAQHVWTQFHLKLPLSKAAKLRLGRKRSSCTSYRICKWDLCLSNSGLQDKFVSSLFPCHDAAPPNGDSAHSPRMTTLWVKFQCVDSKLTTTSSVQAMFVACRHLQAAHFCLMRLKLDEATKPSWSWYIWDPQAPFSDQGGLPSPIPSSESSKATWCGR